MLSAFFDVGIAAFAAFYLWVFASQLETPFFRPFQRWLRRGSRRSLVGCPFCTGFWLSVVFIVALQLFRLDWVVTPLSILASAGVVGLIGGFTPGLDEEEPE